MEKNEKRLINKRLFHNISSPLLFEQSNNKLNRKFIANNINKNFIFKKKLSPLVTSNIKLLNIIRNNKKITLNHHYFLNNSLNLNKKNEQSKEGKKTLRLRGELANANANNIMNKYFFPDDEESHEQCNKFNEEIDINKIMSFYSRVKYKKEKLEIQKIIKNQKNELLFNDHNDHDIDYYDNYYSDRNKAVSSLSPKLILNKNIHIDSSGSLSNLMKKKEKNNNNYIKLDISKKIYHSPIHSLDTVKKNKILHDYVMNNYKNNTIKSFRGLENKLNPLLHLKFNVGSKIGKRIKVLPFIPKLIDTNYNITNKDDDEPNDKNNSEKEYNNRDEHKKELIAINLSKLLGYKNNEKYLLKNKIQYPRLNFPESRSEFVFVQEGKEFILHGGYNVSRKYNLWKFNPVQKSWISIEPIGIKSEIRYAHTGVLHYRNLYIFGGKNFKGTTFADIEIFNLDKKCWIFPRLESSIRIPLRRNHVACGVGNAMFVHGGISEENKYLDDQYILSYKPLRWNDLDISSKIKVPSLAHHSCCLVIPELIKFNSKFNIYNIPELGGRIGITNNNIKEIGIYIFGGISSQDGPINNNLYALRIGRKPLEWTIIRTEGASPSGRYDTSLNFYERGNMLVIHGGRTIKGENDYILNDTFILDLYSLNWIEVEYYNKKYVIPRRYSHQAIIIKGDLYIFGGINGNKYIGSEMFILDLHSNSRCMKEKEEKDFFDLNNKLLNDNRNVIKEEKKREEKNFDINSKKIKRSSYDYKYSTKLIGDAGEINNSRRSVIVKRK